jgi:hypothetical protein
MQAPRRRLARRVAQRQARERRLQRDLMVAERHLGAADGVLRGGGDHLFGHPHQRLIVRVRLVELQHREFGVVLGRNAFVPEVPVDLEHLLEAADGQALQVELRRDPEDRGHVERVVMGDERSCDRAAGNRLHHRRLDLEIAARRHELADGGDDLAACLEHPSRLRVDDEIEIALPVADLDVGEPVPLLRQRQQALRQKMQARGPDRELVGLGSEQPSFDADPVAKIRAACKS